ncbi:hypothetical protein GCM10007426_11650 [Alloalcanivorax dieselolei]|uniref:YadA-like family protein n=1 Tax=Alloalcanivorax dieselolei TaxID=285091 RepID=UPI00166F1610|nr:YadA-like family protein [Alloalcanivorax dieselolei]GGJ84206.1 hypothetical protein GCM10007426_11650 [Alloalcanivorax dieselolei]
MSLSSRIVLHGARHQNGVTSEPIISHTQSHHGLMRRSLLAIGVSIALGVFVMGSEQAQARKFATDGGSCVSAGGGGEIGRLTTGNTSADPVDGTGTYSTVAGCDASGNNQTAATVYGTFSQVTARGGAAFGFNARAGYWASALGLESRATGLASTALGFGSQATARNSVAIGGAGGDGTTPLAEADSTIASGLNSIAIGSDAVRGAQASGQASIAMGPRATASDFATIAIGDRAEATVNHAIAIGQLTRAIGSGTTAVGVDADALQNNTTALGRRAWADASAGTAVGLGSRVETGATRGIAIGGATDETSNGTVDATGTRVTAVDGIAIGSQALSSGERATTLGTGAVASGIDSAALGTTAQATAEGAMAYGRASTASGLSSIAMGDGATASGAQSISIGTGNTVSGDGSGAIGDPTTITGAGSYSVGNDNTIDADEAGVFGNRNILAATATGSRIIGNDNDVDVADAFVIGNGADVTVAEGVALGNGSLSDTGAGVAGYNPTTSAADGLDAGIAATLSTTGAVAVGDAGTGVFRQITGVAAGSEDSDAVNVAQLKASETHYYSVNDNNMISGNYANDGATGVNALAAGVDTAASGTSSVAVGDAATAYNAGGIAVGLNAVAGVDGSATIANDIAQGANATATGGNTVALGSNATATGADSVSLGSNSSASGATSTALGYATQASNTDTTAVGNGAQATGAQDTALGVTALASGGNSTAVGNQAASAGSNATAVGATASASGGQASAFGLGATASNVNATALGVGTQATSFASTAVGNQSTATGQSSVAVGDVAQASGTNAIAIGTGAVASAEDSISIGTGNQVSGIGSGAIGDPTTITGSGSYSVGNNNIIDADEAGVFGNDNILAATATGSRIIGNGNDVDVADAFVIGNGADVTVAEGVALGNGAIADTGAGIQGYNPTTGAADGLDAGIAATLSTTGAVAVGDAGTGVFRQITGVAAGTEDSDAVNVAQLKASETHYYSVNDNGVIGGNYANDGATGINALAAGVDASAAGDGGVATGNNASAVDDNSVAIGTSATANGGNTDFGAVAVGNMATATGDGATALGSETLALADGATAVGDDANALALFSTALGDGAEVDAASISGVAIGAEATASGAPLGTAVGTLATASALQATAVGTGAAASGSQSAAFGAGAQATVAEGVALGTGSIAATAAGVAGYDPLTGLPSTDTSSTWTSTMGAVSVGGAGETRQITNVAAGTNDTDAVNVAQLQASETHYYSVNDNGVVQGNYANDGATGVNALAAGTNALATGESTVAMGNGAEATAIRDVMIGDGAGANAGVGGRDNIAIGGLAGQGRGDNGSFNVATGFMAGQDVTGNANVAYGRLSGQNVEGSENLAFGSSAGRNVIGSDNVGIGQNAGEGVEGINNLAIGHETGRTVVGSQNVGLGISAGSAVTGFNNVGVGALAGASTQGDFNVGVGERAGRIVTGSSNAALGHFAGNRVTGSDNVAIGHYAGTLVHVDPALRVEADRTVSIGTEALASADDAVAIGTGAQANGLNSISIGTGNVVDGDNSGAIGDPTTITGAGSYSVGNNNTIDADEAGVFGNDNILAATATGSRIIGNGNDVDVADAFVIGNGADVTVAEGVALGNGAIADTGAGVQGYNPTTGAADGLDAGIAATLSSTGAVAVGDAGTGVFRQITGVAAGTEDSDAVNVAQLKASETHYYSVNDNGVIGGNYANDGATGINALAAGVDASAAGDGSIAVGGATAGGTSAIAMGTGASVPGNLSVAIGENAQSLGSGSSDWGTVAIGNDSFVTGSSVAGVALGAEASVTGASGVAVGGRTNASGTNAVAMGYLTTASGANSVALGTLSSSTVDHGVALGNNSVANIAAGVAGYDPVTGAPSTDTSSTWLSTRGAVSVGGNGETRQITNVAAGTNDTDAVNVAQLQAGQTHYYSVNDNGVVGGNYNNDGATGINALAGGVDALAGADGATALGLGANASAVDSVALGAGSIADGSTLGSPAYQPLDAGGNPIPVAAPTASSEVSVGSAGNERRITNVAAGAEDTDAVNVSQLAAVESVASTGWDLSAQGADTTNVAPGDTVDLSNTDGNLVIAKNAVDGAQEDVTFDLADDVVVNSSVTVGSVVTSAATNDITGLSNTTLTDPSFATLGRAATEEQLQGVMDSPLGFAGDSGTDVQRVLGETLNIVGGADGSGNTNISTVANGTDTLEIVMTDQPTFGNVTVNTGGGDTINGLSNLTFDPNAFTSGQAATEDQLAQVSDVANTGWDLTAQGADGTNVAPGDTVDLSNTDGNLVIAKNAVDGAQEDVTFDLADDVTIGNSLTVGTVVTSAATNDITGLSNTTLTDPSFATLGRAATEEQLQGVMDSPLGFAGDSGADVQRVLGETLNIVGGADGSGNTNISTVANGTDTLEIVMTDQPTFGNVTVNTGGGDTINGLSNLTFDPNAFTSGQAATEDQLKQVSDVANTGWDLTAQGADGTNVAPGDTVDLSNTDGNLVIAKNAVDGAQEDVTFDLADDVTIGNSLTVGTVVTDATSNDITGLSNTTLTDPSFATMGRAATEEQLTLMGDDVTTLGMNFTGNDNSAGDVHRDLGETLGITGEATTAGTYSGANLQTVTDPTTGAILLQMADSPQFGNVTINTAAGDTINGLSNLTFDPNAFTSGQAATEDQLAQVSDVANTGWDLTAQGADGTNVAPGDTVDLSNTDGNLVIAKNAVDGAQEDVTFDLADDITIGNSLTINNGPILNDNGIDMGGDTITNLGDPVGGGDAVNLDYFEENKAHYYSVNDGGTLQGNYDNDGATGLNAIAAGVNAVSTADGAVAMGFGADASILDSVALGSGSVSDRAIAPASGNIPAGSATITYNTTDKELLGAVSVGDDDSYRQITNVADGVESQDAVTVRQLQGAIGSVITTGTMYFHANSVEPDSIAAGQDSIAVGPNTVVNGDDGIGMGNGAIVEMTAPGGTAIGNSAHVMLADGVALGSSSLAEAEQGVAIGAGATVSHDQSVALGSNSATAEAVGTASTTIAGNTYNFAGIAPESTVSVGDLGNERTITNVAAGRINAASTDAINGSQLFATNQAVEGIGAGWTISAEGGNASNVGVDSVTGNTMDLNNADGNIVVSKAIDSNDVTFDLADDVTIGNSLTVGTVVTDATSNDITGLSNTTLTDPSFATVGRAATEEQLDLVNQDLTSQGLNFTGNDNTAGDVHRDLGETLAITGEATTAGTYSGANLQTVTDPTTGAILLQMADSPQFGNVTINMAAGDTINGLSNLTFDPNAFTSGQAATEDQLAQVSDVANTGWDLTAQGADGTNVAPGDTVDLSNTDGNLVIAKNAVDGAQEDVTFNLADDITIGNNLTVQGDTVVEGDTYLGDNFSVVNNEAHYDGPVTEDTHVVNKQYVDQAGDAVTTLGMNFAGNEGADVHRDLGQTLGITGEASAAGTFSGINLKTVTDPASGAILLQMADAPQFGNVTINEGDSGRITGVTAGVDDTDAVNVGQLEDVSDVASRGWDLSAQGADTTNVAPGDTVDLSNTDGNLVIAKNAVDGTEEAVTFNLSDDVTIGNSLTINNGPVLNDNGIDMGGDTITNLGDPVNGGDAVNLDYFDQNRAHYYSVNDNGVQGGNYDNDGATGVNAIAAGVDASAAGDGAIAMGDGATADDADSVALGSNSITAPMVATTEMVIGGETFAVAGTPVGTVSVGAAGAERTITNVAAGRVDANSTDAINGSQLYATHEVIENLSDEVEAGLTHYYSVNDGGTQGGNYANDGATGVNAIAAGVDATATGEGAIAMGEGATADDANSVALGAGAVTEQAVATADITIGGQTYAFAGAAPVGTLSVGAAGAERTITNVAAGRISADSTDAINGSQLHATNQAVEAVDDRVTNVEGDVSDLGDRVTNVEGDVSNISNDLAQLGDQAVKYDTNDDGSVNYDSITLEGDEGTTITNLADGDVSENSTDAVNGSQLWEVQNQINNIEVSETKYFKANSDAADARAEGAESVAMGPESVASGDNSVAAGNGARAESEGGVALGAGSVASREGMNGQQEAFSNEQVASTQGAVSVGSEGGERQITNVAGGTEATDAVNVRQLGAVEAASVNYDRRDDGSVDYSSVTLGQEGTPTQIHNVAAGEAPTDAANVGQLQQLNQNFNREISGIHNRIDDVEDDANAGTAAALAAASIPQAYLAGKGMISAGAGTYNGESAAAVGLSRLSDNGRWVLKLNATGDSQGNFGAGIGAGFHW